MIQDKEILNIAQTAFSDSVNNTNLALQPRFISNDYKNGKKVLTAIEDELNNCSEFMMSVAFITDGGLTPLLQILAELNEKGIKGKILSTNYKNFTSPKALEKLSSFNNIEVKMYHVKENEPGFHTKGYIFKQDDLYRIIIGSSNLTLWALTLNKEWNMEIVSTQYGKMAQDVIEEFKTLWEEADSLSTWINDYKRIYEKQKEIARQENIISVQQYTLRPNMMQVAFVKNLNRLREAGESRALLISATGTGKTYASAFAIRDINPDKMLFLVHREQIAKQAIRSYKKVFGKSKVLGLLSGNSKNYDAEYLFSTIQMMSKKEILEKFSSEAFDLIVIDEVHRAGAGSYQRIMEYFQPNFWLGMTASPERTDGYDIFELFNHNIAHEIRLQEALEENLLCPFHYFGIKDLEINGTVFDESTGVKNFANLICDARVEYVINKAEYLGHCGDRVKGLIFCSRKEEGRELSKKFNDRGYRTEFLCGDDSQEQREEAIEKLTSDDRVDYLDYIFTVDIFNEGVDIPEVNQVIMLRPTESPVVFVQQLGRGLRKAENKEYVVILDFIGNYMNNFMIPLALSGDRTYNKDTIRKYIANGSRVIPGSSTIHFDEVSKNRIYRSIDQMKGIRRIIKESYHNLKHKLGRVPTLVDFYVNGEVDPILILDYYKTYHVFLMQMEDEYKRAQMEPQEILILEYLSKAVAHGKRPHELEILNDIITKGEVSKKTVQQRLKDKYHLTVSIKSIDGAVSVLQGKFVSKEEELDKYSNVNILQATNDGFYERMRSFYKLMLQMKFREQISDLVQLGLRRYKDIHIEEQRRRGEFFLYEKYSRRDVCQLLDWGKDYSSTMYGMKRIDENVCLFVTYHKGKASGEQEYLDGKPDYADEFVDSQFFRWDSQIGKGINSSYMQDVQEAARKHLFIKKSDGEGNDFYYMGQIDIISIKADKKKDKNGELKDIAKVKCRMHDTVRDDIMKYLRTN